MAGAARSAVLLDALGTLVGIEPPAPRLAALLAARHGVSVEPAAAARAMRAEMSYYRRHCVLARDAASLLELRRACAGVIAAELGGPVARLDRDALTATLLESLRFVAYPDASGALRALRARGARLVVLSNWDVSLHDVLARTGLAGLLDGVLSSAELGVAKPQAAAFMAALELAGVAPANALHVGDSVEEDVVGARAAGIEALLLVRAPGPLLAVGAAAAPAAVPAGVRTIGSLAELAGA